MTLAPLLNASPVIQIHAYAAMLALVLGLLQFVAPKGTIPHRTVGWTWVGLMTVMLVTAFFVRDVTSWSPFSPSVCNWPNKPEKWILRCAGIHVLGVHLALALPYAVLFARRKKVTHHRGSMLAIYLAGAAVAGLFTLDTGRTMNAVVFGSSWRLPDSRMWAPWPSDGTPLVAAGYRHDDGGSLVVGCDTKTKLLFLKFSEPRAAWQVGETKHFMTQPDDGARSSLSNGIVIAPTQLVVVEQATFDLSAMGQAKATFVIGTGDYARVLPTKDFKREIDRVLRACGDH